MTDKYDVGLGNVDNTSDVDKPVSTAQAAALALKVDNSSFSSFGTGLVAVANQGAAASYLGFGNGYLLSVPTGGANANGSQLVIGNDARLSDARTPLAHTQNWSTITNTPTTAAGYGITDIASTSTLALKVDKSSFSTFGYSLVAAADATGTRNLIGLGTSATYNVPATGNAATSQVVIGTDTRLSDSRTPVAHSQAWSTITSTPTTIAGYGITDATNTSSLNASLALKTNVADLANTSSGSNGAGLVGFSPSLSYGSASVGARVDHAGHVSGTNTIIGFNSFSDSALTGTIGYRNVAVGVNALTANKNSSSAGGSNVAVGFAALAANVDGSGNNAVGAFALTSATGVNTSHNNAFGYQSQQANASGTQNNSLGFRTLYSLTAGNNNTAIGESVLYTLGSGNGNTGVGMLALYSKSTGDYSTAIGFNASFTETSGTGNTSVGYRALFTNGIGSKLTAVGNNALNAAEPGDGCTALGFEAVYTANRNAGGAGGSYNTGGGYWALRRVTSGASNSAWGQQALSFVTTGSSNVGVGDSAGFGVVTSSLNTVVGSGSLSNIDGGSNTVIGAGAATPGSAQTWTNITVLGAGAQPTASNQVTLGNTSVAQVVLNGDINVTAGGGAGNVKLKSVGAGIYVAEGSNAKQGTATLVAGSVVVSNTSVTANSRIFLTSQSDGGTPGFLRVSTRTAGTSFTITSSSSTDTSIVAYEIFEPA